MKVTVTAAIESRHTLQQRGSSSNSPDFHMEQTEKEWSDNKVGCKFSLQDKFSNSVQLGQQWQVAREENTPQAVWALAWNNMYKGHKPMSIHNEDGKI